MHHDCFQIICSKSKVNLTFRTIPPLLACSLYSWVANSVHKMGSEHMKTTNCCPDSAHGLPRAQMEHFEPLFHGYWISKQFSPSPFVNAGRKFSLVPLICYILYSLGALSAAEFTAHLETSNFCSSDEPWLQCWLNRLLMFQLTYFPGLWRCVHVCLAGDDLWTLMNWSTCKVLKKNCWNVNCEASVTMAWQYYDIKKRQK